MKAILVIDMPSRCFNCPLHQTVDGEEENEFIVFCNAEHWRESVTHIPIENLDERPSWCPLVPMDAYDMLRDEVKKRMEHPERYAKR